MYLFIYMYIYVNPIHGRYHSCLKNYLGINIVMTIAIWKFGCSDGLGYMAHHFTRGSLRNLLTTVWSIFSNRRRRHSDSSVCVHPWRITILWKVSMCQVRRIWYQTSCHAHGSWHCRCRLSICSWLARTTDIRHSRSYSCINNPLSWCYHCGKVRWQCRNAMWRRDFGAQQRYCLVQLLWRWPCRQSDQSSETLVNLLTWRVWFAVVKWSSGGRISGIVTVWKVERVSFSTNADARRRC